MNEDEADQAKIARWLRQLDAQTDVRNEQERAQLRERYLSLDFACWLAFRRAVKAIDDASCTLPMLGPAFFGASAMINIHGAEPDGKDSCCFFVGGILELLDAWDAEVAEAGGHWLTK